MSDNSHDYQLGDVPTENVTHEEVSDAISEKFSDSITTDTGNLEHQAAEEATEEPKEDQGDSDQFSSKFAALSRKEKEIRARERNIEDKIAQFEAKMAELEAAKQPKEEVKEELPLDYRLKRDPIGTLEELGLTYEQLTNIVLNDGKLPDETKINLLKEDIEKDYKSRFEELESKLLEKERAEEEKKYTEVIDNFKEDIQSQINSSEEYDLIKHQEAYDLVYDLIEEYYQENNKILEVKEAAEQVEAYLEQEVKFLMENSSKVASWTSKTEEPPKQPRQSPTLSNSQAVPGEPKNGGKLLSREDSLRELSKQIKWLE